MVLGAELASPNGGNASQTQFVFENRANVRALFCKVLISFKSSELGDSFSADSFPRMKEWAGAQRASWHILFINDSIEVSACAALVRQVRENSETAVRSKITEQPLLCQDALRRREKKILSTCMFHYEIVLGRKCLRADE